MALYIHTMTEWSYYIDLWMWMCLLKYQMDGELGRHCFYLGQVLCWTLTSHLPGKLRHHACSDTLSQSRQGAELCQVVPWSHFSPHLKREPLQKIQCHTRTSWRQVSEIASYVQIYMCTQDKMKEKSHSKSIVCQWHHYSLYTILYPHLKVLSQLG